MKRIACALVIAFRLFLALPALAGTHYVNPDNPAPEPPYTLWATAATNIQDAIDMAEAGDEVVVADGVYETGAREVYGMSNRVAVTRALIVRSVNGPAVTIIQGYGPAGPAAVRCAYLTNGAVLAGFTLTNGATRSSGDVYQQASGAGVWCEAGGAVVSNCVLVGGSAEWSGGGAHQGTLHNCTLTGNSAYLGGGVYHGTLSNCTLNGNSARYGGGAYQSALRNCTLTSNSAYLGGGAFYGTLNNCALEGNSAIEGGGACFGTLNNCTLSGNVANYAGGVESSTLTNCIVYDNTAPTGANSDADRTYGSTLNYCCTTPLPGSGPGNFTNAPLFVDPAAGNLRLRTNSPCINAGTNTYVLSSSDLAGSARVVGGAVDLGAYECQTPALLACYIWLQGYGLATDSSSMYADADRDGQNNWQEWVAGTVPTNAASVLRLQTQVFNPPGLRLRWSSDASHSYFVQRTTNVHAPLSFTTLRGNIRGSEGVTVYTDATASRSRGAVFYRVGTGGSNSPSPILLEPPVFVPASVTLSWASVTNRSYFVERTTNLAKQAVFSLLQSYIPGQPDTTSFTDTRVPASGPVYYRVGVQP